MKRAGVIALSCALLASAGAAPALPLPPPSVEVLASDEATIRGRVVLADGFRYQILDSLVPTKRDDKIVYTDGTMTVWATAERFTGTLDQLVARESRAGAKAGAKLLDVVPAPIHRGDVIDDAHARRLVLAFSDRTELRTVVVEAGAAYIHHCEGEDCIAWSATIAVAQPPLPDRTPPGFDAGQDAIFHQATKLDSPPGGWQRGTVVPWVEHQLAPAFKLCILKAQFGIDWEVRFDVAASGAGSHIVAVRSVGDSAPSPAPADVAACLAAALAAHPLRVRASVKGIAHVTATFEVPSDP